ncbi:SDR family oxidoreductase [bacterium]|nr:SDR family oxidoreductase [bacterium]
MPKKVFVTGATRGIGKAIATMFSQKSDYEIYITGRNKELLNEVFNEIGAKGFFVADLANKADLENLKIELSKIEPDILVNNAGEYIYGGIEKMGYEEILHIFETNLIAPVNLISATVESMKRKKWGRIVNIGSISGVMGEAYASLYSGSKSGLIGMTKALALEVASDNITVNTINPGWVETELGMESVEESEFSLEETVETIPQKRFVQVEEVAGMVEYLCGEKAKGVTGQSINLCAGLSVGY